MSNAVPLSFKVSPIPDTFRGTLNDFAQAFASRLSAETGYQISFFVTGNTAPTSNVGPWLRNGSEWWVWDNATADYVPITVPSESLGYIAQVAPGPDQAVYTFWIELDGSGKAQAIKFYSGGAWKDIYEDKFATYSTTAQMNSAISAAISSAIGSLPSAVAGQDVFKARPSSDQDVVFGGAGSDFGVVALGAVDFDPDSRFSSSRFTAPANGYYQFNAALRITVGGGSPTDVDLNGYFTINGSYQDILNDEAGPDGTNGRTCTGSTVLYLTAGQYVELYYNITVDASCTVTIQDEFTRLSGYRIR